MIKEGEKDLYSQFYEENTPIEKRSKFAQYFTHKEIVEYILNSLPIKEDSLVIDPSCGAGAFLIEVLKRNNNNIKNIYGIDIDIEALNLCKSNIENQNNISPNNLIHENSLKLERFKSYFDFVVGNPPFKHLKSDNIDYPINYPLFKEVRKGVVNSATLMVAKSYEMLKEKGYLGFVLPKNVIRVDSFKKLRKFLIENTRIKKIFDIDQHFKDVRGDQIILILQKEKLDDLEKEKNLIEIIPYKKGKSLQEQKGYYLKQSDLLNYSFFPLFYSEEVKKLADRLLNIKNKLENNADIFRGISINPKDPLIKKEIFENSINCYRGDSIKRFGIKYKLYTDKNIIQKKDERMLKKKVILQNLYSKEGGVFATLSDENEVNLDTVSNIVPHENISPEIILGIISSKLANFFFIHVLYLNSNFTMHTDKTYIGKLPFVVPNNNQEKRIKEIVKKLLSIEDKYSKEFKENYTLLNKEIYKLYNLDENECSLLEKSLEEVMSKKNG